MEGTHKYPELYDELEVIGRGNFAHLVKHKQNEQLAIAKKIQLSGLKPNEILSAHQEAEVLKNLRHPNIVSYFDSFCENDVLIIIMEYCEEGDMAFHIKRKRATGTQFSEDVILNWFLQTCMALLYIHDKKILHRDIKTQNIFLTSNGTIKLGDFGISKVLENSITSAKTVVGTPYYLSPEACENNPYNSKSDIWALGCVLYELCTLKHAFDASNLLGLVFKIVKGSYDPIPDIYTENLKDLINKLLDKNSQKRPSILEIFSDVFVKSTMMNFINQRGLNKTQQNEIPVKQIPYHQKQGPSETKNGNTDNQQQNSTNNNTQTQNLDNLTPQQRMKLRKEEKIRLEEEQLKQAAREKHLEINNSKMKKQNELRESNFQETQEYNTLSSIQFDATGKSDQYNTLKSLQLDATGKTENFQTLKTLNLEKTLQTMNITQQENKQIVQQMQNSNKHDEMPIQSRYHKNQVEKKNSLNETDEYLQEKFESFQSDSEIVRLTNKMSNSDMNKQIDVYQKYLEPGLQNISEKSIECSNSQSQMMYSKENKISKLENQCFDQIGKDQFEKVYKFMKTERNKNTPDGIIRTQLISMIGKEQLQVAFLVDQIIFLEQD